MRSLKRVSKYFVGCWKYRVIGSLNSLGPQAPFCLQQRDYKLSQVCFSENPYDLMDDANSDHLDPIGEKINITEENSPDIDKRMKYFYELYSIYRISVFTSLGIVFIVVLLVVLFRKYLSKRLSKEVAEIGSKSLDEENLKNSANALSRKIISEMLADEEIAQLSLQFMKNLFEHPEVRVAMVGIIQNLLQDEEVRCRCEKVLVNTWKSITVDPVSLDNASQFFGRIFSSPDVKISVERLFIQIFSEESMKNETAKFYSDVLEQSVFRDRFFNLTKNTLNRVIIQDRTQENAKKFICKILEDEEMKQEASQFLFDAAKLMITPKWFLSSSKPQEKEKEEGDVNEKEQEQEETDKEKPKEEDDVAAV